MLQLSVVEATLLAPHKAFLMVLLSFSFGGCGNIYIDAQNTGTLKDLTHIIVTFVSNNRITRA